MWDWSFDDQLLYPNKRTYEYVGVRGVIDGGVIHLFLQPFISFLEPKLHTPELTFSRCPFLFTVGPSPLSISLDISTALTSIKPHIVCAIVLRYSDKPEV